MYRYGTVTFYEGGEKGAKLKRTLVERMNTAGVISVSEESIDKWYREDLAENYPSSHKFALHNRAELDIFRTIMESEEMNDPSIKWSVSRFERNSHIREWMDGVEKRRQEAERNGEREKV